MSRAQAPFFQVSRSRRPRNGRWESHDGRRTKSWKIGGVSPWCPCDVICVTHCVCFGGMLTHWMLFCADQLLQPCRIYYSGDRPAQ
ncbi:hypothetical protein A0H81_14559 [Grifola frondosa]|uniref:Uncharacterized protein n=1 Tax=Grifola frondosa TaxID=5627 RepID=A0A1C7LN68_GRIFR|nr:hypothetical protein A0H81_14559 [Grifola frondosa]